MAIFHPHSGADGAGGLTGEVSGALTFYQHGCRAADDGSSYQCWWCINSVSAVKMIEKHWKSSKTERAVFIKLCDTGHTDSYFFD